MTTTGSPLTMDRDAGNRRASVAVAALVTVVVGLYCWQRLGRGWVPHDEGTIAQSAERVLRHEVPHHDFIDVYTGGLSYLNAWAMQAFGLSLRAPREVLFILFVGWVPLLYYCIAKFVSPLTAGGLTLLAVMWSYPMYPAALPSWYILFLATLGIAALLRYIDDQRDGVARPGRGSRRTRHARQGIGRLLCRRGTALPRAPGAGADRDPGTRPCRRAKARLAAAARHRPPAARVRPAHAGAPQVERRHGPPFRAAVRGAWRDDAGHRMAAATRDVPVTPARCPSHTVSRSCSGWPCRSGCSPCPISAGGSSGNS